MFQFSLVDCLYIIIFLFFSFFFFTVIRHVFFKTLAPLEHNIQQIKSQRSVFTRR